MKTSVLPLLLIATLLGYAPAAHAKAKKKDNDAGKTAIDILTDTAPATTETILAPLGSKVPPKLRADITALREKLLDEAAKAPAAPVDAYKAAVSLSDGFLAALDERDKIGATAKSAPMGTADMASSKAVHPDEEQLEQEAIDAKKKKQDDAKQNAFFNDAQKQAWTQRATQWHTYLDQLYAQMGDIRRKAAAAAATPTPAPK